MGSSVLIKRVAILYPHPPCRLLPKDISLLTLEYPMGVSYDYIKYKQSLIEPKLFLEHFDTATVNIYIVSDVHKVEFVFQNEMNLVNASRSRVSILGKCTNVDMILGLFFL